MDLAPSALTYYFYSLLLACGFIGVPVLIFYLQKKDLKYEIRHRIIPNETQYRNKNWKLRIADIGFGIIIGTLFYFIGNFLYFLTKNVIIAWLGADFFKIAQDGSVNTVPPPPPPSNAIIWLLIISGVIVQFGVVALSEEFCFRGVLLKELNHKSLPLGILLSSFFFMIYHILPGVVPIQTTLVFSVYYFVFGLLLSFSALIQKQDLITAIVAHGTFNSILWVMQYISYLE